MFVIIFIAAILINIIEMALIKDIELIAIMINSIIAVIAGIILIPYYIDYKIKEEKTEKSKVRK